MQRLLDLINVYTELSDAEKASLIQAVDKKVFQKNDLRFSEGRVSNDIYFVVKGCVRLYYNADGLDKTAFFYTEGQFICAGESYTFNIPAKENYQAVELTELFVISKSSIESLLAYSRKFEVIARIATENELIVCQNIIASFVTKTPEERYVNLIETQGELFQRVPQQYIASYLGIAPETLSRIKTRVFRKMHS